MNSQDLPAAAKHAVDGAAIAMTAATIIKLLPAIAAALSIVWTVIRIYETATVQGVIARLRALRGKDGADG